MKQLLFFLFILPALLLAQEQGTISGKIKSQNEGEAVSFSTVVIQELNLNTQTNIDGVFSFENIPYGEYTLVIDYIGFEKTFTKIKVNKAKVKLNISLKSKASELATVNINGNNDEMGNMKRLKSIEGLMINEGKKNEVIVLADANVNKATNQGRQIYSRIPGLNIWESDGAGIQLGIGGRGLNPSRTSNFNTRQNGYDISADALGYPESYYTPPSEAIKEIQLIRGAASLQFGTQFGGLLNFKLHDGPESKKFESVTRQSFGSFGLSNTFTSIGFNNKGWKGYAYLQYKQGNDWRPNSEFNIYSGAFNITKQLNKKAKVRIEYTKMYYLLHQPGGLTDKEFYEDPLLSKRERNWFEVDWNLAAASFNYDFSSRTKTKTQFFGLLASRNALGVLGNISRPDVTSEERDLITGDFKNFGNETRFLHIYTVKDNYWAFLIGARYYQGYNLSKQGKADSTNLPHFTFVNPDNLEGTNYEFPSKNIAVFSENIIRINKHFSITPGVRFEYISTNAEGSYRFIAKNIQGDPLIDPVTGENLYDTTFYDSKTNNRSLLIGGIGTNYKFNDTIDLYANFSQNYRSINFTDMQIKNKNFRIDPNLKDETGFNADIGIRGFIKNKLNYDISAFVLYYDNRIGNIDSTDLETFVPFRYRTNISKALTKGVEAMVEVDFWKMFVTDTTDLSIRGFVNIAFTDAKYTDSRNSAFKNKLVEFVPPFNFKAGPTIVYKHFTASYQITYVQEHYTDATNAGKDANGNIIFIPNAIIGTIPSYTVMDLSFKYQREHYRIETGINNLANESFFTRRATGYPGPGIIPSAVRNYYIALQYNF